MSGSNFKAECAKRDAEGVPVPAIARVMGYSTWTEWGTEMSKPHPILMGMPWRTIENAAADAGRETYRVELPKRLGSFVKQTNPDIIAGGTVEDSV